MTRFPLDAPCLDHSPLAFVDADDRLPLGYLGPIDQFTDSAFGQGAAQGVYLNEEEVAERAASTGLGSAPSTKRFRHVYGQLAQGKFVTSFLDAPPIWPRISALTRFRGVGAGRAGPLWRLLDPLRSISCPVPQHMAGLFNSQREPVFLVNTSICSCAVIADVVVCGWT